MDYSVKRVYLGWLPKLLLLWVILFGVSMGLQQSVPAVAQQEDRSTVVAFSCTEVTDIPQAECQALVDLYTSTNGAAWVNAGGWLTTPTPCTWYGIGCDNGHVIDINIRSNQMQGDLPTSLSNLTQLHWLILADNKLVGPLPVTLSNLTQLQSLDLYRNQFTGTIPAGLGNLTNLTFLSLGENQLNGALPPQLGNLIKLEYLYLPHNQLTDAIPVEIGQLQNLRELTMENNQLQGALPAAVGNLTRLTKLYLWRNQLTGTIPATLGNLTQLQVLSLSDNQLNGAIPPELGGMTALQELTLSGNQLTGSIPVALGALPNLRALYLGNNRLTGGIPSALGSLVNLQHLTLYNNPLQGEISSALGNLPALEELDLGSAGLTGAIPGTLGNLSTLRKLVLWGNQLQGTIPGGLGNLVQLQVLALSDNQLTGALPANLTALTPLTELYLSNNQLTGAIPPTLSNLTNIITLTLSNNQFNGSVPAELGRLPHLQSLYLGHNQLTGTIPAALGDLEALEVLDLQQNQLNGAIPPQLGNLTKLRILHLGENQLSGAIPGEIGQLVNLRLLLLWSNRFTGVIPPALAQLTKLQGLFLSGNQLQGEIPPWLGTLTQLQELNLSSNQLTGTIPASLGNLSALRRLHLNHNQLTGPLLAELGNLGKLEHLILWVNQLSGPLPTTLGNLQQLTVLGLSENQFSGSLPATVGNLAKLTELHLHTNHLSGALPAALGNLVTLQRLYLARNAFSGEIPPALTNLTQVTTLEIGYNMLTAPDPAVQAFLDAKATNWQVTQTTTPVGVQAKALNSQVVQLSWTPPLYQQDHGGYQVSYGTSAGGPYTIQIPISNKATTRFNIGGLTPGQGYYFTLRTYTPAHDTQQNDLWSAASAEVTVQMPPPPIAGDDYDDCTTAKAIGMDGLAAEFSFQQPNDVDWLRFDGQQGVTYRVDIQVPNGSPADVILDLYEECTAAPLESWDVNYTLGARLTVTARQAAPIYLRMSNHVATVAGAHVIYAVAVQALNDQPEPGALIIVEGRLRLNDPIQANIYQTTDWVYRLYQEQGYTNDDIYYLALTANRPGADATSTLENLHFAITTWAPTRLKPGRALTLYLMDHGDKGQLYLDEINQQRLTPAQLDEWLTELQVAMPDVKINLILEACYAGSFLQGERSVSKAGRVVITSTNSTAPAWASEKGARFSDQLLTALAQGFHLTASFQTAREAVRQAYIEQEPWLDANGNAIPNEADDYVIAAGRSFAAPGTLSSLVDLWPPYIAQVQPVTVQDSRGQLRVEVRDDTQVTDVWAVIYPPSYVAPTASEALVQDSLQTVKLLAQGDNWYSASYSGFDEEGIYRIVFFAKDDKDMQAQPVTLQLTIGRQSYLPLITR